MERSGIDLLVCALPMNVLMLTGYCPVVGASIALANRHGEFTLVVPADEEELAGKSWADDIITFEAASLEKIVALPDAICGGVRKAFDSVTVKDGAIGIEAGDYWQPAPYVGSHAFSGSVEAILSRVRPEAQLLPAADMLAGLRGIKTRAEVEHVRTACSLAGASYEETREKLAPGITEKQAAVLAGAALGLCLNDARCEGSAYCMSGPNAAKAYAAYQMSRGRPLAKGDLVLLHVNSHVNGYWTDVTRTYCVGEPDDRQKSMYAAVFEARAAALDVIGPGVRASEVDRAARSVMEKHGFGREFRHPTGHGVGFAAIDHNARPCIHPASAETLEIGMVFNVEPGIYIEDYSGMRHCDVVAVTEAGHDVLTPFHSTIEQLTLAT